ncbi:MAG TPA: glucodextranase DOMON-like domain-containing protein [Acidobacteriota bacterium]|nr:glucodextranase DOMON-like domain-containing protein [Acidobacteriota bacterium]
MLTKQSKSCLVVLMLAMFSLLTSSALLDAGNQRTIFTLQDSRDDDYGDGTLAYPLLRDDLQPGDLDLITLSARPEKDGTLFVATFARPIRNPGARTIDDYGTLIEWYARFGFYTFNVDIYIDTDRIPRSGSTLALPGRHIEIDPAHAWEKAVVLTPRPYEARILLERYINSSAGAKMRGFDAEMPQEDQTKFKNLVKDDIKARFFFPTRIRVVGHTIQFFVPQSFLGGLAKDWWSYAVVVSGADLTVKTDIGALFGWKKESMPNLMALPTTNGASTYGFGGFRDEGPLQPPIVDILVPTGRSQEEILGSNITSHFAQLPGVVPIQELENPRKFLSNLHTATDARGLYGLFSISCCDRNRCFVFSEPRISTGQRLHNVVHSDANIVSGIFFLKLKT